MKKVASGTYKSFFDALVKAENSACKSIFTYNSYAERYTMLRFVLNRSNVVKIYCFDISLFTIGSKNKLIEEVKSDSTDIYKLFCREFINFFSKQDSRLEILLDDEDIISADMIAEELQDKFQAELSSGKLSIKKIREDVNLVKGMNHFVVAPDLNLVCFDQGNNKLQICSINDKNIVSSSKIVFDGLYGISSLVQFESNTCDE